MSNDGAGIEPYITALGIKIYKHRLIPKRMISGQLEGCIVKCFVCNTYFDGCIKRIIVVSYPVGNRYDFSHTCSNKCANFLVLQVM